MALGRPKRAIPRLEWYSSPDSIFEALRDNDVVLLKATWLIDVSRTKGSIVGRRQSLPPEAFWKHKEIFNPNGKLHRTITAISHPWLTRDHPDPEGRHLQIIAECLGFLVPVYGDIAVYWDWCSLHQQPRSSEEQLSFERALQSSHLWWMHSQTMKLLVTKEVDTAGTLQYYDRGWTNFEREVSFMNTPASSVLDLSNFGPSCQDYKSTADICRGRRPPPITPKDLSERLAKKHFAHETDRIVVERLYHECFMSWISAIKDLNFAAHEYNDEDISILAGAIRHCGRLIHLDLSANRMTNEGAKKLAAAVPRCRKLAHLELQGNPIGNLGATMLQKSWAHVKKPENGLIVVSVDRVEQDSSSSGPLALEAEPADTDAPDFFYEGMYKNNQRNGLGTLGNRITGFKYVGHFKDDLFDGHGVATWQDGSTYTGQWHGGQKSGKGEFTSPGGLKYVGEWVNGHRHGHGLQEYDDGGKYTGMWHGGVCGGQGVYDFIDGSRYEGGWRRGRYNGPGVMHHKDATTEKLQYQDGLLMSRTVLHSETLPSVSTRHGSSMMMSFHKASIRQKRDDVHQPTYLPALQLSPNLIARSSTGFDLSAPRLRPRSAERLSNAAPAIMDATMPPLPLTAR